MNTERILKLVAYFGLLFLIVYAVASAFGQRASVVPKQVRSGNSCKGRKAQGSVWARNSVPVAITSPPPAVAPTPPAPTLYTR